MIVWVQKWEETETGWGVRPDGYSIHLTLEDIGHYVAGMRETEAKLGYSRANPPPEYSRPSGDPYEADITDKRILGKLAASKHGCQFHGNDYPTPVKQGADATGWVRIESPVPDPSPTVCLHSAQDWYIDKATRKRGCSECDRERQDQRTKGQLAEMIALGERALKALSAMDPKGDKP